MSSSKGLNIWQAARLYLTCIKSIEIIISAFRFDWWKFCWISLGIIADLIAGLLCWFALLCWSWEPLLRDFLLLDWEPLLKTSTCCWFGCLDALFIGVSTIPEKGNKGCRGTPPYHSWGSTASNIQFHWPHHWPHFEQRHTCFQRSVRAHPVESPWEIPPLVPTSDPLHAETVSHR